MHAKDADIMNTFEKIAAFISAADTPCLVHCLMGVNTDPDLNAKYLRRLNHYACIG